MEMFFDLKEFRDQIKSCFTVFCLKQPESSVGQQQTPSSDQEHTVNDPFLDHFISFTLKVVLLS